MIVNTQAAKAYGQNMIDMAGNIEKLNDTVKRIKQIGLDIKGVPSEVAKDINNYACEHITEYEQELLQR